MRKKLVSLLFLLLPILVFSAMGSGVAAQQPSSHPNIRIRLSTSSNWSGYAAESSIASPANNFVNAVSGNWQVPTLTCSPSQNTYVAIWVGIDGYSDGTVEQTGTEQQCVSGVQQNYAWVEMYPHPMQTISGMTVSPGDAFTASVTVTNTGQFAISIKDSTTGKSFSNTYNAKSAQRQSAEWIVEAPYSGGVLPLANFGTVGFTNAQFTTSTGTFAIDGKGQGTYDTITMQDPNGGTATPSALSDSGAASSFTVTYSSSTTTTTTTASSGSTTLSVQVSTDKSSYTRNSWAYITVTVTANGAPVGGAAVTLTVTSPNGGTSQGSGTTNGSGQTTFKYRVSPNAATGTYTAGALASAAGYTSGTGSTTFTVQ
jgi:hypothetical protein